MRAGRELAAGSVRLAAAQCKGFDAFHAMFGIAIPAHLHLAHGTLAAIIDGHNGQGGFGIVEIDNGPIG
jgi:hypothetical protein